MKNYISFFRILLVIFTAFTVTSCVHDDKYNDPDLTNYQCADLVKTKTYQQVRALYTGNSPANTTYVFPDDSQDVIEGYVSSTDESGNIYKTIYIQDALENPTEGFVISVDAVSTYTKFPQGSKIYIKLAGLAVGTYGGLIQLGVKDNTPGALPTAVARIPEKRIPQSIFKSCTAEIGKVVPKVMTLAEMNTSNDRFLGCLIQVNDAEFDSKVLCSVFAPEGYSVDRQINDPGTSLTTRVVRNSGFASFSNQKLPAGKGKFIGILSKFNSSYQMYINKISDLDDMVHFPRKDGIAKNPCEFDATGLTQKTIAEVKQLYTGGNYNLITGDYYITGTVTANDETGNLYKYFYLEDATGGIKININKTNLYQDPRFKVGRKLNIKLKDLYVGSQNGERAIGGLFNGNFGQMEETVLYNHFYPTNDAVKPVTATDRTITQITTDDVGRWIKIKDLQFTNDDIGSAFSGDRTLEDCSGNKITLRTSSFADFGGAEVDGGKGDVYGILSYSANKYQLWIPYQYNADLDNPRCDGTLPPSYETLFSDPFTNLNNWTATNVTGAQEWKTTTFGNPAPSAIMDGARQLNEDWLISKKITLGIAYKDVFFSFETDGRYTGNALEVYVSDNYNGSVSSATWTKMTPKLDTDLNAFAGFVGSGRVSLNNYLGKEVVIAFKYTSVSGFSTTWEVDNFKVKGAK